MSISIGRRDNNDNGTHEFFLTDDGEVYVFHVVKQGRVSKQKRLAAEAKAAQPQQPQTEEG